MSVFNFELKSTMSINSNLDDLDTESAFISKHYNRLPNVYSILHYIYSDKFWNYLKNNFTIKEENIIVTTDMSVDIKNREQKSHQYLIHIEEPDIFLSFYDEEKITDDEDYFELVDESEKSNKITTIKIYYSYENTKKIVNEIIPEIKKLIHLPSVKNQFFIISTGDNGFELRNTYISKKEVDLELSYGAGFTKKHENIVKSIKEGKSGLYIFNGESGTGKTTYLRKLISELSEDKTFIYVPAYLMYELANPELISFISKYKNSVLILEDAENVITTQVEDRTQAISNILNLSDGLLNDAISVQIIVTFNVNRKVIDSALTRSGRLKINHKFKALSVDDANKLAIFLNVNKTFTKPTVLADIYQKPSDDLVELTNLGTKKFGFNTEDEE